MLGLLMPSAEPPERWQELTFVNRDVKTDRGAKYRVFYGNDGGVHAVVFQ